jgi:hypothetical protein
MLTARCWNADGPCVSIGLTNAVWEVAKADNDVHEEEQWHE